MSHEVQWKTQELLNVADEGDLHLRTWERGKNNMRVIEMRRIGSDGAYFSVMLSEHGWTEVGNWGLESFRVTGSGLGIYTDLWRLMVG